MAHIFQTGIFDNSHLDQLHAYVYATVIKRSIEQLEIINQCKDTTTAIIKLEYVPLYEKYSNCEQLSRKKSDNHEKFQKDYSFLLTILNLIKSELLTNHSYTNLIKTVEIHKIEEDESRELLERNKRLHKDLDELNEKIHKENASYSSRIHESIENIGLLKDELFETEDQINIKTEYIKQYERSQQQQEEIKSNDTIKRFEIILENLKQKLNGEIRNHEEITIFLQETMKDCNQTIQEWIDKYFKETKEMDGKIKELRKNFENLHKKHSQLKNIYNEREEEINDYLAYKERKRLEFEEIQRRIQATIKIQAWWRGTMYRKCLGPYRRRKTRKETAKKSKKK